MDYSSFSFATVTEHMVEKRASKLELFLESVARHTFLRKDIVFIHFIHSMDPIDKQVGFVYSTFGLLSRIVNV